MPECCLASHSLFEAVQIPVDEAAADILIRHLALRGHVIEHESLRHRANESQRDQDITEVELPKEEKE